MSTRSDFLVVLTGSLFAAPVYETYGELILEEKYRPPDFTMPLGLKDMRAVLAAAEAKNVPNAGREPPARSFHHRHCAWQGRPRLDSQGQLLS